MFREENVDKTVTQHSIATILYLLSTIINFFHISTQIRKGFTVVVILLINKIRYTSHVR